MTIPWLLVGLLAGVASSGAAPSVALGVPRPSETPPPPSCLDRTIRDELGQSLRPRGVQKKTFLRKHRVELLALGGLYAADLASSSYVYGAAGSYWIEEDLGVEVAVTRSPVALDLARPVNEFFGDPPMSETNALLGVASVLWSPIHFKVKTADGDVLHGDAMLALGGGRLFHETAQGLAIAGGLAIELYASRRLSFRFDARDVFVVQELVGETRQTHNIEALVGLGFWIF